MDMNDMADIVEDKLYKETLQSVAKSINITIERKFEAIDKNLCLEAMKYAEITKEQLLDCLANDSKRIENFTIKHWQYFNSDEEDDDVLPQSPGLLIDRICDFYLLKYREQGALLNYWKKMRIPQLRKHISDLRSIYNSTE